MSVQKRARNATAGYLTCLRDISSFFRFGLLRFTNYECHFRFANRILNPFPSDHAAVCRGVTSRKVKHRPYRNGSPRRRSIECTKRPSFRFSPPPPWANLRNVGSCKYGISCTVRIPADRFPSFATSVASLFFFLFSITYRSVCTLLFLSLFQR